MSQGSFFDGVQDELFDAPPVRRAPSAPAGPTLEEQSAAAQVVHDVWAERLACTVPAESALDRAVLAHRADPSEANKAEVMRLMVAHRDRFHREQTDDFIRRTR
jgi:hypothetical protein